MTFNKIRIALPIVLVVAAAMFASWTIGSHLRHRTVQASYSQPYYSDTWLDATLQRPVDAETNASQTGCGCPMCCNV